MARTMRWLIWLFLGTSLAGGAGGAELDVNERRQFLIEKFGDYRLNHPKQLGSKIVLQSEPLLRFTNPISGVIEAGVFAWKRDGYPYAIGKIFVNEKKKAWGEYISSVAKHPMQMRGNGSVVWSPTKQESFRRLGGFPAPAKSKAARRSQMRRIAQQFQVLDLWKEDPIVGDQTDSDWTLRLLTTPLLRYDAAQANVMDGVVFAFVLGTNPEVLLSIEAKEEDSKPYWQYRFTRLTIYELQAFRKKEKVWQAKRVMADEMPRDMPSYHKWQVFDIYPFKRSVPVAGSVAADGLPAAY